MMARPIRRFALVALVAPLLASPLACSSGGDGGAAKAGTTVPGKSASKGTKGIRGSGNARITIGGETWSFESAACGFGEEEIGVPGAVVNASASANGLSLYLADDGESRSAYIELASLDDPDEGLNWTTEAVEESPAIKIDGKKVTADATFGSMNDTGGVETKKGSVEVNCG